MPAAVWYVFPPKREDAPMGFILVNDRCLYRTGTGAAGYLLQVLRHWPDESPHRVRGFVTHGLKKRGDFPSPSGATGDDLPLALRPLAHLGRATRLGRRLPHWARRGLQKTYNIAMALHFRRKRYCGYWEPNHLAIHCGGPTVTTILDLSVLEHPRWHPADRVAQWRADLARSVANTDAFIAISEFTKSRMVDLLQIDAERITAAPLAGRPLPYPRPDLLDSARARAGLPEAYLLHLGTLEPRKNLAVLLDAYRRLPAKMRHRCPLILAGGAGWGEPAFWTHLLTHPVSEEVLTTGYVSDRAAAVLLAGATAVMVPSLYEGFGLPILEAMACATPVVCSTAEAFVEVAGDAAAMCDPSDTGAWTRAMRRAIEDEHWRESAGAAGAERAKQFSWRRTARLHAEVFEKLI